MSCTSTPETAEPLMLHTLLTFPPVCQGVVRSLLFPLDL